VIINHIVKPYQKLKRLHLPRQQEPDMKTLMGRLREEEDRLDQELEDSHGEFDKMKVVFEMKIQLYGRYLNKQEGLTELDRLMLLNKNGACHTCYLLLCMKKIIQSLVNLQSVSIG
jgi:hypothetical protein